MNNQYLAVEGQDVPTQLVAEYQVAANWVVAIGTGVLSLMFVAFLIGFAVRFLFH